MNHLLNKDWEYVLHIYEEEMKESTSGGGGGTSKINGVWACDIKKKRKKRKK